VRANTPAHAARSRWRQACSALPPPDASALAALVAESAPAAARPVRPPEGGPPRVTVELDALDTQAFEAAAAKVDALQPGLLRR